MAYRKLPIHILPMVVAKFQKLIPRGILEKAPQTGSNWASLIVAIRICGDYAEGITKYTQTHFYCQILKLQAMN